ncbi:unnamed protein product [Symbiodinium sp. CCMP2592]|nr:unnamed protein product [Symbiodinium sp. CCMP2592]
MENCRFCRSETPECFECEACLSEGGYGPGRTVYVCRACVRQGVACECDKAITMEDIATPAEHLVRYFHREGIQAACDTDTVRIERAVAALITRECGVWWYRLYSCRHAGSRQLQLSTGVLFALDAAEGRLVRELDSSESESFRSAFWWKRPWTAWVLSMIRFKAGPVNLMSLCPTYPSRERLARDLMKQGIRPGTEGKPCALSLATVVLVTEEGPWRPWYFFYPFQSVDEGEQVMHKWSGTVGILFRLRLSAERDAIRLVEAGLNTPCFERLWQQSLRAIRSKTDV